MKPVYKIHPGIGIARVGDSPAGFYLAPEQPGALPIACDAQGNATLSPAGAELTTSTFKDAQGRILRQGARFQVYVYDTDNPNGRPLKIGDRVEGTEGGGPLLDIQWSAYLANKKASWYTFAQLAGEHGYAKGHPLRNPGISDPARQNLIIDPGVQTVNCTTARSAEFAFGANPGRPQNFPPPLQPVSISTLGGLKTDDAGRLIVLGGHGCSGSMLSGFGEPKITNFANNDGWFDDVSDGPVTAILMYNDDRDAAPHIVQVDESGWVLVGNPAFVPEILNIVTLDDVLCDLYVREFAFEPAIYGNDFGEPVQIDSTDSAALDRWRRMRNRWNPDYYVYFERDIAPILMRPYNAQWVTNFLGISHDAHEINRGGDFEFSKISLPPKGCSDPYGPMRVFIFNALRQPGIENAFSNTTLSPGDRGYDKPLMPLLCGDNPLDNQLASKFLTLTRTQFFFLQQWAVGKFISEAQESIQQQDIVRGGPGVQLDRGVLANVLGGSFCPGGEIGWIARNPAIYSKPYRIKADASYLPIAGSGRPSGAPFNPPVLSLNENLQAGLQPGDLTKRSALPWQADFNECTTQSVDITYEAWNLLYDTSKDPGVQDATRRTNITLWWPAHRPLQVYRIKAQSDPTKFNSYAQIEWTRGIPSTNAGDLMMTTAWKKLGFVVKNPYDPGGKSSQVNFIEIEGPS